MDGSLPFVARRRQLVAQISVASRLQRRLVQQNHYHCFSAATRSSSFACSRHWSIIPDSSTLTSTSAGNFRILILVSLISNSNGNDTRILCYRAGRPTLSLHRSVGRTIWNRLWQRALKRSCKAASHYRRPCSPTFETVVLPYDQTGHLLGRVLGVFQSSAKLFEYRGCNECKPTYLHS
jgi:hypothetical protein